MRRRSEMQHLFLFPHKTSFPKIVSQERKTIIIIVEIIRQGLIVIYSRKRLHVFCVTVFAVS